MLLCQREPSKDESYHNTHESLLQRDTSHATSLWNPANARVMLHFSSTNERYAPIHSCGRVAWGTRKARKMPGFIGRRQAQCFHHRAQLA